MRTRFHREVYALGMSMLLCSSTLAQDYPGILPPPWRPRGPTVVTVTYLSTHPKEMDGKRVSVRARLEMGWEGDNFLVDPGDESVQAERPSKPPARIWIYCDPRDEWRVCAPVFDASVGRGYKGAVATFIGRFHFEPDRKAQWKGVFQTGPLQLSADSVSDIVRLSP
jgi:hypothetical protein